jgi:membrane-bound lytic murein transglycosylase B
MLQSTYKGVKEGLLKVVTGSLMLGILPLQLLAPVSLNQTDTNTTAWQTQLIIADTTPDLLTNQTDTAPVIEKVTSRYDEEQAKIAAAAAAKKKAQTKSVTLASVPAKTLDVPYEQKESLVNKAAVTYNVPAQLILAVWLKESGLRWYFTGGSTVGARGPAQFMPGTWKTYGVDGNGDGVKDIANAEDAIFGMARYLAANGANRGDYTSALYRYNHSTSYVNSVLALANIQ